MAEFTFVDLFCGIGGFHQAAIKFGGECVFACDIDESARAAYYANYGIMPEGDITKTNPVDIPHYDVLFAGFPCQPFSIMGNRLGFNDMRGTLFFNIITILKENQPKLFILENVKQLVGHNNGKTLRSILGALENLGYKTFHKVLNALDFGLPQKRERTIIVGFDNLNADFCFPAPQGRGSLDGILEKDVDAKHFVSDHISRKRMQAHKSAFSPGIWHENKSGHISSYPFSCALRAGASYNYLLVDGRRRLTPREMLRLQGFPDSFEIICTDSQTRKQAGNAVPVNMVSAVLKEALKELQRSSKTNGKLKQASL
ncbi:MAG: DNA (cytosine-5-)-methyltransferase [Deltaproteobacteria bacterium]|jgi:DNA (cytosine-5)-methyltransferase 1|nr:DNA (cytosine-5-)-methyltransferase [Deltaproteobacteria bacterium]